MKLPVELATNVGVLLGTASAVGYACGYLALRARSFALGTDPAFKLVDQVYVFAGVRFLVITLIVALLLAPAILAIRWVALGLARALPDAMAGALQWLTLIAIAAMTLGSMSILSVHGLLLRNDLPASGLEAAVLGGSGGLRLALTFAPVLLAGLSAVWLYGRLSVGGSALGLILGLVVALQAFMLPIYHGALFADRRVRVLAGDARGRARPGRAAGDRRPDGRSGDAPRQRRQRAARPGDGGAREARRHPGAGRGAARGLPWAARRSRPETGGGRRARAAGAGCGRERCGGRAGRGERWR